jgi:hypothetical protein
MPTAKDRQRLGITSREQLFADLLKIRKRVFGAPVDFDAIHREAARKRVADLSNRSDLLDNDDWEDGDPNVTLDAHAASELLPHAATPLDPADRSALADAIRATFPTANPQYQGMVKRRFVELYRDLPEADAVKAVLAGYASPSAAMRAGVISKRDFVGFKERD